MNDSAPHLVVLTRCWEFHLVDGLCVAARNRRTGAPVGFHEAHGGRVVGSARLDTESGRFQLSPSLRLGESLAIDGTRGRFHSAPILAIEGHDRQQGERLLTRIRTLPPRAPKASPARPGLRQLWERLTAPTGGLRPSGAAA